MKINLGCGRKYLEGYVNCDVVATVRADRYFDLNTFPYPFADGSADEIFMDNVMEHLDDVVRVMTELHRILRPGGVLRIIVPYAKTDWAFQDPTHKHFFTERSMDYFTAENPYSFYLPCRFKVLESRLYGDRESWRQRARNLLPFKSVLRFFLNNIYDCVSFRLEKA